MEPEEEIPIQIGRKPHRMNPRSLANLRPPFQPGNPGGGRKRESPLMKQLRRLAKQKREAEAVARAAFDAAQDPQNSQMMAAQKHIFDRIDGPIVQESRSAVATQIVILSTIPEPAWDKEADND